MTAGSRIEKPPGAWTANQVADMLLDGMAAGDFYILCPDNDVTRETDNKRILWPPGISRRTARRSRAGTRTTRTRSLAFCSLSKRESEGKARPSFLKKRSKKLLDGCRAVLGPSRPWITKNQP